MLNSKTLSMMLKRAAEQYPDHRWRCVVIIRTPTMKTIHYISSGSRASSPSPDRPLCTTHSDEVGETLRPPARRFAPAICACTKRETLTTNSNVSTFRCITSRTWDGKENLPGLSCCSSGLILRPTVDAVVSIFLQLGVCVFFAWCVTRCQAWNRKLYSMEGEWSRVRVRV